MTGWSTITFETKPYEEKEDIQDWRQLVNKHGVKLPRELLAHELFTLNNKPRTVTTRNGVVGGVIARWSGYRQWSLNEKVLEAVTPLVTHAVVVRANDTTDTGSARLYQQVDGEFRCTDQYTETQDEGLHVGEKAASYMHATHGVPALSHTRQTHRQFRNKTELEESDYF